MDLSVFFAALLSAVLHAGWNAATRTRPDPGTAYASIVVMAGVVAIPILAVSGLPALEAWPYALLGTLINVIVSRLIMATYRQMPFSVAYPITRGVTPVSVAVIGVILLGDALPGGLALAGILLISGAVLLLAQSSSGREKVTMRGLALAIGTGISIALFIVIDARGARLSGNAVGYASVMAILSGLAMPVALAFEGLWPKHFLKGNIKFGLLASTVSTASYILVVWGLTHGPVGPVAALRETSVLFAMGIATFLLKERVGFRRVIAAILAVCGIALLRLS